MLQRRIRPRHVHGIDRHRACHGFEIAAQAIDKEFGSNKLIANDGDTHLLRHRIVLFKKVFEMSLSMQRRRGVQIILHKRFSAFSLCVFSASLRLRVKRCFHCKRASHTGIIA
jgi:hypothetical protein